ncbi:MAG: hypothetical protein KAV99_04480 [Candidatus Latescibacteria bacterium]|nr:hypothetical protein [Candidatus Latescibacterota bacterium]
MDVQGEVPDEEYLVPFGSADIKRQGTDVTVVATLRMVYEAIDAANRLEEEEISLEVIDPRTLVPLDEETIFRSVKKTGKLIIVHEDNLTGGWGAEVAALVAEKAFDYLDAPIKRICAPNTPVPFAPVMENYYLPGAEDIINGVRQLCR